MITLQVPDKRGCFVEKTNLLAAVFVNLQVLHGHQRGNLSRPECGHIVARHSSMHTMIHSKMMRSSCITNTMYHWSGDLIWLLASDSTACQRQEFLCRSFSGSNTIITVHNLTYAMLQVVGKFGKPPPEPARLHGDELVVATRHVTQTMHQSHIMFAPSLLLWILGIQRVTYFVVEVW